AHAKAREVVLALGVEAGEPGGLAADEPAAGELAALRDAGHDLGGRVGDEIAGAVVVVKEERLGAGAGDVVRTHRQQVLPDRTVLSGEEGDLHLGAAAVRTRHEDGRAVTGGKGDQAREAPHALEHFAALRRAGQGSDHADEAVSLLDVHAAVTV